MTAGKREEKVIEVRVMPAIFGGETREQRRAVRAN